MNKLLVVYFSRTGTTRRIAEEIATRLHADLEEVREGRSRRGIFGYLRSAREAMAKRIGEIAAATHDPSHYDLVVIGSPVWASNLSSPVRAYVTRHLGQFRNVAFFCTQGGSGGPAVLKDMALLCGQQPVGTLVLNQRQIKASRHRQHVDAFAASLRTGERNSLR